MALGMSPGQAQAMGQGYQGGDTMGSPSGYSPNIDISVLQDIAEQMKTQQNNQNLGVLGVTSSKLFGTDKSRIDFSKYGLENIQMPTDDPINYGITGSNQAVTTMPTNMNLNIDEKSGIEKLGGGLNFNVGPGNLNFQNPLQGGGTLGFQYNYNR
tara:strand:- start:565 stop:1029 length:465 start_codon:yes stop_codon:yes gene_type:complete